jgi:hypothetical protein
MLNKTDKIALATVAQRAALGDRGRAILSFVGPILTSSLLSINQERMADARVGRDSILVRQLAYLLKPGDDGARGDAFEYALYRSVRRCDRGVVDPLFEVLHVCGVPDDTIDSIFFARDKQGEPVLIDLDPHLIDKKTMIIPGQGQPPVRVHEHLGIIDKALRSKRYRSMLPTSISGFAKADLLIGNCKENVWLGATVKSNPFKLERAPGLAIGIIPSRSGSCVAPRRDEKLDMWIVEVPYDNEFMELFSCAWQIVTAFFLADTQLPKTDVMGDGEHRRVAAMLTRLRDVPVVEAAAMLENEGQPGLLAVETTEVTTLALGGTGEVATSMTTQLYPLPHSAMTTVAAV